MRSWVWTDRVIPTLAERSRQQRLQALAQQRPQAPCQVPLEPPLALQAYLQKLVESESAPEPEATAAADPAVASVRAAIGSTPFHCEHALRPLPAWVELLLWLTVLLIEAAMALRALLGEASARTPQPAPQRPQRQMAQPSRSLTSCSIQASSSARFC
jgi:hypothetical protein